jgi:hypothetical protein
MKWPKANGDENRHISTQAKEKARAQEPLIWSHFYQLRENLAELITDELGPEESPESCHYGGMGSLLRRKVPCSTLGVVALLELQGTCLCSTNLLFHIVSTEKHRFGVKGPSYTCVSSDSMLCRVVGMQWAFTNGLIDSVKEKTELDTNVVKTYFTHDYCNWGKEASV